MASMRLQRHLQIVNKVLYQKKMFYIIGLGLGDAEDITVKGLRIVKKCDRVYLENYTSILTVGKEALVRNLTSKFLAVR